MVTSILSLMITTPMGAILSATCANKLVQRSAVVVPDKINDAPEVTDNQITKDDNSQFDTDTVINHV